MSETTWPLALYLRGIPGVEQTWQQVPPERDPDEMRQIGYTVVEVIPATSEQQVEVGEAARRSMLKAADALLPFYQEGKPAPYGVVRSTWHTLMAALARADEQPATPTQQQDQPEPECRIATTRTGSMASGCPLVEVGGGDG